MKKNNTLINVAYLFGFCLIINVFSTGRLDYLIARSLGTLAGATFIAAIIWFIRKSAHRNKLPEVRFADKYFKYAGFILLINTAVVALSFINNNKEDARRSQIIEEQGSEFWEEIREKAFDSSGKVTSFRFPENVGDDKAITLLKSVANEILDAEVGFQSRISALNLKPLNANNLTSLPSFISYRSALKDRINISNEAVAWYEVGVKMKINELFDKSGVRIFTAEDIREWFSQFNADTYYISGLMFAEQLALVDFLKLNRDMWSPDTETGAFLFKSGEHLDSFNSHLKKIESLRDDLLNAIEAQGE